MTNIYTEISSADEQSVFDQKDDMVWHIHYHKHNMQIIKNKNNKNK